VPGRGDGEPPRFIRAGGGYPEPWTRDAAVNAWSAASMLEPEAARDTLLMVCERLPDGRRVIAQDNQWWDQVIWIIAACQHALATGDGTFGELAFAIGRDSLAILDRDRYRPRYGLYVGGSFMQDGISGYPQPPNDPGIQSSFVLDYPLAREIMCLSTNALYVGALQALASLADLTGAPSPGYRDRAARLADAINDRLWIEGDGCYGYFLHGADGGQPGRVDRHQEAAGLGFALMFGVATGRRRDLVLANTHREPCGVVNVWPHFPERYSDERPGRHNVLCWPMVMGIFGEAAARAGSVAVLDQILLDLQALFAGSGDEFFELYNARTGAPDGGWQCGRPWGSEPDQTWSATALLRLVHLGLLGIRYSAAGMSFEPVVPSRFDGAVLSDLPYRQATLDISVTGHGRVLKAVRLDGEPASGPVHIPANLAGRHRVELEMG
ncbi:MAG: MGH1-like glycoside hydrolase domain-containing protein, partial [Trebonia sp.]